MSTGKDFNYITEGNKRAILLLHGLTGHPYEMKFLAKTLNKGGFDTFVPVLIGHCNGVEAVKQTTWEEWLDFALEQFDELKKQYDEVYIGGLCLGAVLACAVAEERPDLAGICCFSTTLFLNGWEIPWYKFLNPIISNTIIRFFYVFPEAGSYGIKNERISKRISNTANDNSTVLDCIPMVCFHELLKFAKYTMKNAEKINIPAIFFHSEEDNLTSIKSAKFMYKNISSKEKKLVKLNDCYHVITLDNKKEEVAQKTLEFFNSVSKYTESYDIEKEMDLSYA